MRSSRLFLHVATALSALVCGASARAELFLSAQLFPLDGPRTTPLYTYKSDHEKKGDHLVITNTFTAADGTIAVIETAELAGDEHGKLVTYKQEQKQVSTIGVVEMKDGKAHFSFTKDDKTKTDEESAGDDFLVTPMVMPFLQAHWTDLTAGKTAKFRYAVVDRRESIGFEFSKEKEETLNGEKVFVFKMRPSSFVIAALVNPLHFYITPDGKHLREIHGRTQPKQQDHGRWKDLDVVTVYQEAGGASK